MKLATTDCWAPEGRKGGRWATEEGFGCSHVITWGSPWPLSVFFSLVHFSLSFFCYFSSSCLASEIAHFASRVSFALGQATVQTSAFCVRGAFAWGQTDGWCSTSQNLRLSLGGSRGQSRTFWAHLGSAVWRQPFGKWSGEWAWSTGGKDPHFLGVSEWGEEGRGDWSYLGSIKNAWRGET